jgi:hypothetical protein
VKLLGDSSCFESSCSQVRVPALLCTMLSPLDKSLDSPFGAPPGKYELFPESKAFQMLFDHALEPGPDHLQR